MLESALRNGIVLEHSCLRRRCSSCKYQAIQGEPTVKSKEFSLFDEDKVAIYVLTCVQEPLSDILLNAEDLS